MTQIVVRMDVMMMIAPRISQRNLAGLEELIQYILIRDLPFTINYYREHEFSSQVNDLRFDETQIITTMRGVFALIDCNIYKALFPHILRLEVPRLLEYYSPLVA